MFPTGQTRAIDNPLPSPTSATINAPVTSISTSSFLPDKPARWERHVHDQHELLWGARGFLAAETDTGLHVVPAMMGLWIPAGMAHAVQAWRGTTFHCSFVDARTVPFPPHRPTAVAVPLAARELLLHMQAHGMEPGARNRCEQVVVDLLATLEDGPPSLPMPSDDRLVRIAAALLANPSLDTSLEQWGAEVGASARNLSRLFQAQTATTFEQWRIQVRLRLAMGLLATGMPVATVGRKVGYKTSSAFVQSFRRVLGCTPGHYVASMVSCTEHSLSGGTPNPTAPAAESMLG